MLAASPLRADTSAGSNGLVCADPIAGTWRSRTYFPSRGEWLLITATVRRVPGSTSALRGAFVTAEWNGTARDSEPPASCGPGDSYHIYDAGLGGRLVGTSLEFWTAGDIKEKPICGGYLGHERGRSRGTVDVARGIFEARFGTGRSWSDESLRYIRISCDAR